MITVMLMCDLHGWVWATLLCPRSIIYYVVHFLVVKVINKKLSFYKL